MDEDQRTGLVLLTPALEDVVDRWRRQYDPVRAYGMPAHVTVLYPWLPYDVISSDDRAGLVALCASTSTIEMTFTQFGTFAETLWLDPQPSRPIIELINRIAARWPDYPPFAGEFADVVPHMTLADRCDPASVTDVIADVEPQLPVVERVPALTLMRLVDNRWIAEAEFPFRGG